MEPKIVTFFALALVLQASAAQAESSETPNDIWLEGPLARQPACRQCVLYREGRFSLSPTATFSILDEHRRSIFFGLRAQYNITDWLGVSIAFGWGSFWGDALDTGLTEEIALKAPIGIETNRANYPFAPDRAGGEDAGRLTTDLLGRFLGFLSAEVVFIPLRGKFGLFSRLFLAVDLYLFAGYALPFVEERAAVDCRTAELVENPGHHGGIPPTTPLEERCPWVGQSSQATAPQVPRDDPRVALGAGTYGAGVSIYLNRWIAVNMEYRVVPMLWNPSGTDERGMSLEEGQLTFCPSDLPGVCESTGEFPDHRLNVNDRRWTAHHLVTFGATFHFPLTPRVSP